LLRPTSGDFEIGGLDPTAHAHEVRRRFGIVFQDPSLDGELTAYENMELHGVFYHVPRKTRITRTEELLRLFELWERRDEQVKRFSGGMKRRLEMRADCFTRRRSCFSMSRHWGLIRRPETSSGHM
jgi:ABC-2 type transport system ATP-binding protein